MLALGDAHADDADNREALLSAYRESGADVALQVGDLLHYALPAPTWFVAGNDENLDVIDALRRDESLEGVENAHLLASEAAQVAGLRVAGLSGNYAPTQYDRSRSELSGDRRRHFTREEVDRAKELDDVDVFLAHEPPHGLLTVRGYDPGRQPVDEVLEAVEPDLCLVGHHHRHAEGTFGPTRVVALAPAWEARYRLDPATLDVERIPAGGS